MGNQTEMRHLRYFLAVAEELHFRRAAERLYISQPGLSRQVRQFEEQLGFPLLERTNRRVSLTPAGAYLRDEARSLLQQFDAAVAHARDLHRGRAGRINFGYVGSAMQNLLPNLLLRFRQTHPEVTYGLEALGNQDQLDKLLTRDIDIGFVRLAQTPPELVSVPLFEDTFSLVLPRDHPLTAATFTGVEQLRDERFILFDPDYSRPYYEQVMTIFADAGFAPEISHRTVHATTIYRLVENNFGLSIVPTSLQAGYAMDVQFIELNGIPQRTTLSAVWRRDNDNPAVGEFLKLLTGGD